MDLNTTLTNHDSMQMAQHTITQAAQLTWDLNDPDQLAGVQDLVAAAMENLGYLPREQYAVQMGLQESVFNAFEHGNSMNPMKKVSVAATVCEDKVWVRVEDEGEGFNVEKVPDPTLPENLMRIDGRGIYMMRAFLDSVDYEPPGNVVTFTKKRNVEN